MSPCARVGGPRLSAECALAGRDGYEDLHDACRRTRDVPLPHGGGLVLVPRCTCACHRHGASGERSVSVPTLDHGTVTT